METYLDIIERAAKDYLKENKYESIMYVSKHLNSVSVCNKKKSAKFGDEYMTVDRCLVVEEIMKRIKKEIKKSIQKQYKKDVDVFTKYTARSSCIDEMEKKSINSKKKNFIYIVGVACFDNVNIYIDVGFKKDEGIFIIPTRELSDYGVTYKYIDDFYKKVDIKKSNDFILNWMHKYYETEKKVETEETKQFRKDTKEMLLKMFL